MSTPERHSVPPPTPPGSDDGETAFVSDAPPEVTLSSTLEREIVSGPLGDADRAGIGPWAIVVAIVVIVGAGRHVAFDLDRAGSLSFWAFAIGPTLLIAFFGLVRSARDGDLADLARPAWGDATQGLLAAAVLIALAHAFVHVIAPPGTPRESWTARIYLQLGDPRWLRSHLGIVAAMVLTLAAAEEIVWRGLVTRLIAERLGSRGAWAWAALPYAAAQVPTVWGLRDPEAGLNPLVIVAALFLGLVWGAMARRSRRLVPAMLCHAAFAWCVIMVFRLWGNGT